MIAEPCANIDALEGGPEHLRAPGVHNLISDVVSVTGTSSGGLHNGACSSAKRKALHSVSPENRDVGRTTTDKGGLHSSCVARSSGRRRVINSDNEREP